MSTSDDIYRARMAREHPPLTAAEREAKRAHAQAEHDRKKAAQIKETRLCDQLHEQIEMLIQRLIPLLDADEWSDAEEFTRMLRRNIVGVKLSYGIGFYDKIVIATNHRCYHATEFGLADFRNVHRTSAMLERIVQELRETIATYERKVR